uniref:Ig-like domain-containing protein n=1 Tax=Poecilia mexicana TaxID=48701 RepID=A0A3B3XDJ3_9TELE
MKWSLSINCLKYGKLQVKIGSHKFLEMLEGQSVLLFCEFPTDDMDRPTVEWSRSDLSPSTVHVYQNGSDQPGEQNQIYRTRTRMDEDPLKTGDLSLTLTRPTDGDTGEYRCIVLREAIPVRVKCFHLNVKAGTVQVQSEDIGARISSAELIPLLAHCGLWSLWVGRLSLNILTNFLSSKCLGQTVENSMCFSFQRQNSSNNSRNVQRKFVSLTINVNFRTELYHAGSWYKV